MKLCSFCNAVLEEDANSCPACGAPIESDAVAEFAEDAPVIELPKPVQPARPRKMRAFLRKIVDRTRRSGRANPEGQKPNDDTQSSDPTLHQTAGGFIAPQPPAGFEFVPAVDESPGGDSAEPEGPRTLGEGDFTIAFDGDLSEADAFAPPADTDPADGPLTVASNDFTIAFAPTDEDPIAGIVGPRGAIDDDAPRTPTESDYTVAFTPSQPDAALPVDQGDASDEDSGPRTISNNDYTIAFEDVAPPEPVAGRVTTPTDLTLDSASLADKLPGAIAGDDKGPRAVTESDYTFDFVDKPPEEGAPGMATRGVGMTIDAGELPPDELERLTGMWESTIPPEARPGMTIKASSPGSATQTHLVVRPRTVRPPEEPAPDGADYELLETIGKGGMGVVYSARQASIDRTVAIKMIRRDLAADADQRQKFLSEAVVTGDLDHPNIVPIYDLGANESGALFYSMKRVEGTPWIKVLRKKPLTENIEILMKVADAVAFAHSRGVVHRDLKPENVMLGEFGEVLVMDWGLALLAPRFRHLGSITQSGGMGGTPAYMSPEMASGPMERIGPASDVYLLGAILFEVLTGKPPHVGKDVMSCLYAVARNEIAPTEVTGELMEIARRAMSTEIDNRYGSVLDFQAAIRLYHSHSESITLSDRAAEDIEIAKESRDYQDFARAVFGFQEALSLWDGNDKARERLLIAKSAYATCAADKGDLDLAASLLDADEPSFAELRNKVTRAQRERDVRSKRLKFLVRAARALVATVVVVVTVAFFAIRAQREEAKAQAARADKEARNARVAEGDAKKQRDQARDSEKQAVAAEKQAVAAEQQALAAEKQATEQRNIAVDAEKRAQADRDKALAAEQAEATLREQEEKLRKQREYEAYIAQIGLVAAKIDENAFGYAAQLLEECPSPLRNWEWGRLMHLCRQSTQAFAEEGPIDSASFSPDGKQVITGSWEGNARIWDVATGKAIHNIKHGMYVHAVAYSPDGRLVATGSNDKDGELRLWKAATGEPVKTLDGHTDAVLSVVFSRDGKRLLSSSYDKTARLWDVESGEQLREFKGHTWWVWCAAFSPDEKRVVTASQDGTAIVWTIPADPAQSPEKSAPFTGHVGPVYSAAFSPDGRYVATGGYDKRILLWRPDQVKAFDFGTLLTPNAAMASNHHALQGHSAPVRCVRFSADGKTLITASHDNTIKLWDLQQSHCRQTLRGHAGWVRTCSFSPDGNSVLSAGYDHQAKIWNTATYEEVRTFGGHNDALLGAEFSPDGQQIITVSRDRTAKIQDVARGGSSTTLSEGHAFLVSTVAFSTDGRRVFTGAGDDTIRVWDVATGGELRQFDGTGRGGIFAMTRDGARLLSGSDAGTCRLWDVQTGEVLTELTDHRSDVTALAISPDLSLLYTGDAVGRGRIWNAATGKMLHLLEGHSRKITAAYFVADGKRLLTASTDNTVGQWDVLTGKELATQILKHPNGVVAMTVSPDGNTAITACADHQVRVWNLPNSQLTRVINTHDCEVTSVALSPDGRRVITACADHKVRLWDLASSAEIKNPRNRAAGEALIDAGQNAVWSAVFSPDGAHVVTAGGNDAKLWRTDSGREEISFSPHGAVAAGAFSPDGQHVATCSWDGTIKVWDAATGNVELKLVASPEKYVNTVMYSRDGTRLLSASDDATAKIWDAKTGELLLTLPPNENVAGHRESVRSARFSPDGSRVVTASSDKTARLWDANTGESLAVLAGHEWAVLTAVFSADGARVMTGSEDNTVRIWDAGTGNCLFVLQGHTAAVTSVAFSPDGTRAATGGQDNAVKLWDATTGKEILHLKQHSQEISSVAFSPNGKLLLTSSRDGTAIVWPAADWH